MIFLHPLQLRPAHRHHEHTTKFPFCALSYCPIFFPTRTKTISSRDRPPLATTPSSFPPKRLLLSLIGLSVLVSTFIRFNRIPPFLVLFHQMSPSPQQRMSVSRSMRYARRVLAPPENFTVRHTTIIIFPSYFLTFLFLFRRGFPSLGLSLCP